MKTRLLVDFFGHFAYWGMVLGAISGFIYGALFSIYELSISALLYTVFNGIYYLIAGAVIGIILGGIVGVISGVMTLTIFSTDRHKQRYRRYMISLSMIVTFLGSLLLVWAFMRFFSVTGEVSFIAVIIPAVIATIAAGYAGHRVSVWHLEQRETY